MRFACFCAVTDMFWDEPWQPEEEMKWCIKNKGVTPRPLWATQQWGGRKIKTASNIIFSNGQYDPWSVGGVLEDINESVVALIVKEVRTSTADGNQNESFQSATKNLWFPFLT